MNLGSAMATAVGPMASIDAGQGRTFSALQMGILGGSPDCSAVLETSSDGSNWVPRVKATGERWGSTATDVADRYVRANVMSLGTGLSVSVNITGYAVTAPIPVGGGIPGFISAMPSADPYTWAMCWLAYHTTEVTGFKKFGHTDKTAAPVTSMDITGNDGNALDIYNLHYVVVTTDVQSNITVSDNNSGSDWVPIMSGGQDGCWTSIFVENHAAYNASDVVTVTSDVPTAMAGVMFQVSGPGSQLGSSTRFWGDYSNAAQVGVPGDGSGPPGDGTLTLLTVIASSDGKPNDPNGYPNITRVDGSGTPPISVTVSLGLF